MKGQSLVVLAGLLIFGAILSGGLFGNNSNVFASSCSGEVRTPVRNTVKAIRGTEPVKKLVSVLKRSNSCSGSKSRSCSGS